MARSIEFNGITFYEPKLRWKNGRAYIRFYDPEKQPIQKDYPLHTNDPTAAAQLFQQRRFEYLNGALLPWTQKRQEGVTVKEAIKRYLKDAEVRKSSLRCKRLRLEPFSRENPGMLVSGINPDNVRAYCYRKDLKVSTQQRYLYEMKLFIDYCQEYGWITSNPAIDVKKATPKRKKRANRELTEYLTPEEVRRIIAAIEYEVETQPGRRGRKVLVDMILFGVTTGLRLGEICNLQWNDVRLFDPPKQTRAGGVQYGWISIKSRENAETKTGDEDRVPVVPQAYELLKRLRKEQGTSGYVFEAVREKSKINGWWVSNRFRYYRRLAKIRDEIHFHSLRHTCASWLAEAGVDLKVIQEILRHSNIRQTMRYAHLIPDVVANKMVRAYQNMRL